MFLFAFLVWFYFSLPQKLFNVPYSTIIEDESSVFLSARIASDYQWRFPQPDSVPYKFKESIRLFEDEYFYKHIGVNPVSIYRATKQNIAKSKVISGGSTISMQVIRLCKKYKKRSWYIKLYEIILALRLELRYSKEEIMNLYAAHAPFGGNVVGVEAASWRYFNRPAHMLSWSESAALAVLPNAPALVFPGKNHNAFLKKRNKLLQKLYEKGVIDAITCQMAKAEPLPEKPFALKQLAPHLLNKAIFDGYVGQRVHSTLQYQKQKHIQAIAAKYARYYSMNYIHNMSVLVLDTKTGKVLAYIGNVDIGSKQTNKYVDNIVSRRSSGSLLKPFLYAAMLHDGDLLPNSLVADIPTRIGGYAPQNFELTYEGAIPAADALSRSLNIPFVRLLQEYGLDKFHFLLQQLGLHTIDKTPDHYGLSLILGGAEVSLWDITSLYASLGRSLLTYNEQNGMYNSSDYAPAQYANFRMPEPKMVKQEKLNASSLYFTLQAMASLNRPWGEIGWEYFASSQKIAWKTGTSFGHRDAWSVGVTPEYTIGVWVGNSTGEGRPGLTGISHAAPVMFEICKYLQPKKWFAKPHEDITRIAVCKQSGYRATELCKEVIVDVPKNGIRVKSCPYHQAVFLDSLGKQRVSGNCYSVNAMKKVSWFVLPPAQEWFYKKNNPNYVQLPPYKDGCVPARENMLDVLVPDNNSALFVPTGLDGVEGKVIFEAIHRNPNAILYWHIDGEYITSTKDFHSIEVDPIAGNHTLVVVDEQGNSIERKYRVLQK